jgi:hypothetical protein
MVLKIVYRIVHLSVNILKWRLYTNMISSDQIVFLRCSMGYNMLNFFLILPS